MVNFIRNKKKKKNMSDGGSVSNLGAESDETVKRNRTGGSPKTSPPVNDWKVMIVFVENFHLILVAEALEKEVGK